MDETPAEIRWRNVFGADGLEVAYGGVSLAGNYTESEVLDVRASNGKQFMALEIDMTNPTERVITLDNHHFKGKVYSGLFCGWSREYAGFCLYNDHDNGFFNL